MSAVRMSGSCVVEFWAVADGTEPSTKLNTASDQCIVSVKARRYA
jgi:hypothetical protein